MTIKRIIAIIFIFLFGVSGWLVLSEVSWMRSTQTIQSLDSSVQALWGAPIVQPAPKVSVKVPGTERIRAIAPNRNLIEVDIELEQRRKGLLWYPTYTVDFVGRYEITNHARIAQDIRFNFTLPSQYATYENIALKIGNRVESVNPASGFGLQQIIPLQPNASEIVEVRYLTRGLESWIYQFDIDQGMVRGLNLAVDTNFTDVDFVAGSLSPMQTEMHPDGLRIEWQAGELLTRQNVGIVMPQKLNPGPLAARMTFFAPVCLLFFFVLITAICVVYRIDIHPMHYLFVNAGFFAFHLLFAYTIDVINVHLAFFLSSLVSVLLVVSYLVKALGKTFPWRIAALGQLIYLVLFSYSFFIDGMTGLTVTIASIVTLAVLMRITAETNWSEVFVRRPRTA